MTASEGRGRGGGGHHQEDMHRLERLMEKISERVARLERIMYIMSGLGSATVITAVYNLAQNLSQARELTGK